MEDAAIAPVTETGSLGVVHLKRLWSSACRARAGRPGRRDDESHRDRLVIDALGLGLHQTLSFLHLDDPTFPEFEAWIVATAGRPDERLVARLNADVLGAGRPAEVRRWLESVEHDEPVLTCGDLEAWETHGFVVLRGAVPDDQAADAERAIWGHRGADPSEPTSW